MSFFKKILILAAALVLVSAPAFVYAQYGIEETQKATGNLLPKNIAGKSSITEVVGSVVSIALSLIGIVFFLLVLYAGFTWMTAMGNTEKVTKAKDMLEAAAIGLILVMASYAIARFVFTSLGGSAGLTNGGLADCSSITAEESCYQANCVWSPNNGTCINKTSICSAIVAEQPCYAAGCAWSPNAGTCGSK